jgi:hypothetical protein
MKVKFLLIVLFILIKGPENAALITDKEWSALIEGEMTMNELQLRKHEEFLAKIN